MFLNITIHTPVGIFKGHINEKSVESKELLENLRDKIERMDVTFINIKVRTQRIKLC